ncbi:CCA tRNA nucleotidyltransferase [Aquibacillus halophilus]|uniref:CCA-adding enzyme n=1 Tax=Aquibacillus halophilus TaxID=930132 RepID=A0A6A8D9I8_9BACI|nr:CCA tRNA nucleotidyltransferase [Aquibacillus halophilus]MRH42425.1 CCA tRNA nucleotidyltransferase [Aquibacillus halophilus]
MLDDAFRKAITIIERIELHGHKAYFVGGAVRDQYLSKEIGDIDITSSASPVEIQQMFDKVIPVGIEHGTVIVRIEGESYEVTTFRVEEGYSDFRRPDRVRFVDRIEDDLARRDFTINAIAMDKRGNLIDPFGGKKDIELRQIRTVGNPVDRFQEDPLRIMRALRFSSQLGFTINQSTKEALVNYIAWIEKIAIERISTELEKMFNGYFISNAIPLFVESNIGHYLPIFRDNLNLINDLNNHSVPLCSFSEIIAMFHLIKQDISVKDWVSEWKLSNKIEKEATILVNAIDHYREKSLDNWLIYSLPTNLFKAFIRLHSIFFPKSNLDLEQLNQMKMDLPIHSRKDLNLNGIEITNLFPDVPKGAWINNCLYQLERYVVLGHLNNQKNELKEWAKNGIHPESFNRNLRKEQE